MLCASQDHPFGADAVFLWTRVRCLFVPQLLMATVLTADGLERYARASAGSKNCQQTIQGACILQSVDGGFIKVRFGPWQRALSLSPAREYQGKEASASREYVLKISGTGSKQSGSV